MHSCFVSINVFQPGYITDACILEDSFSLDETGTDSKEIRILQNGNLLEKEHQVS